MSLKSHTRKLLGLPDIRVHLVPESNSKVLKSCCHSVQCVRTSQAASLAMVLCMCVSMCLCVVQILCVCVCVDAHTLVPVCGSQRRTPVSPSILDLVFYDMCVCM